MSLINDALKRVEKSLNDNSPIQQSKQKNSSLTLEPSGSSKKLFFITLIGGTLFFSILILLLILVFSNTSLTPPSQTTTIPPSTTPSLPQNLETHHEPHQIEPPSAPIHTQINPPQPLNNYSPDQPKETSAHSTTNNTETSTTTPDHPIHPSTEEKTFNQELFEGILNVASRAFINKSPSSTSSPHPALTQQTPKENLHLSTAQKTLDIIEQEAQQSKNFPENKTQQFINSLSITGVMISKDESMVLINNRVFLKNAIINPDLNLQLIDIQPQKITLQDNSGSTYTVDF